MAVRSDVDARKVVFNKAREFGLVLAPSSEMVSRKYVDTVPLAASL
jgi:hypothetical protein